MKKIKSITRTIDQYEESCPVCDYKILGTSESQVKYNLKVHCMQKHNLIIDIKKLHKNQTAKQIKKEVKK